MATTLRSSGIQMGSSIMDVSGSQASFICRMWVRHNNGSINGSFNVSSVVRNGTGWYTVNFATAMVDANYCVTSSARRGGGIVAAHITNIATTSCQLKHDEESVGADVDTDVNCVSVFR